MEKVKDFLRKLYRMRFRISRKGTPVLNWSVLFSVVCLIFAPKLTAAGLIIALLLGYEFSFDEKGAGFGTKDIEEKFRNVAKSFRGGTSGASAAAKAEPGKDAVKETAGEAAKEAEHGTAAAAETDSVREETAAPADADPNRDVLADLERHADDFMSNPAATTFHSAYSAMADSVPTLEFPADDRPEDSPGHLSGANA